MKTVRLALLLALTSCTAVDGTALTNAACPTWDDATTTGLEFAPVSTVLEQRCGTLDCHGQMSRPLRIFGQLGLRSPLPGDAKGIDPTKYFSGTDAVITTDAEMRDNYESVCSLEPELMTLVVTHQAGPDTLTFFRKPRLLEKHKGGLLWNGGDPGDQCFTNWLIGDPNLGPCDDEVKNHR